MSIPTNLKYTKDHEWVSIEGDVATVGITHFAQKELGDIVYVEVETLDQTLEKDEVFGTVEAVKTVSDLFLPLSGEIIEFNEALRWIDVSSEIAFSYIDLLDHGHSVDAPLIGKIGAIVGLQQGQVGDVWLDRDGLAAIPCGRCC